MVLEEYGKMANGEKEIFLVTKSPFKDENGKLLGIIGTAVNVSKSIPRFYMILWCHYCHQTKLYPKFI